MRVFYIFNIKDEFMSLYKDNPSTLYSIFRQIYSLNDTDLSYAKTLFNQLINNFDKYNLDQYLFIKFHKDYEYSKKGEIHCINNLYKNEISKMIIKNKFIRIVCDANYSSFIPILAHKNKNLFICDFENTDFFFPIRIKHLV